MGFRYFSKRLADGLELTGWVRNVPDGGVEAVASGTEQALDSFEEGLREGPPAARVETIETSSIRAVPHTKGFSIVR